MIRYSIEVDGQTLQERYPIALFPCDAFRKGRAEMHIPDIVVGAVRFSAVDGAEGLGGHVYVFKTLTPEARRCIALLGEQLGVPVQIRSEDRSVYRVSREMFPELIPRI